MTHDERVYYHQYVKPKIPAENADLIASLEELVLHMRTCIEHYEPDGSVSCELCPLNNGTQNCDFDARIEKLGIEE